MHRSSLLALLAVAALSAACGGSSSSDPLPTTQTVAIDFKALAGTHAFNCADTAGYSLGLGTASAIPHDLRYYVSNVRLVDAANHEAPVTLDPSVWQNYGVALLDFENGTGGCTVGTAETNTTVHGTVAVGTYTGLKFDVGVPAAVNHLNVQAAEQPLSISAMYWSWTSGYKFVKIEMNALKPGAAAQSTYNFHLGSTGCTLGTPGDFTTAACTTLNVPTVSLSSFNASTQAVALDLAVLFQGTNFDLADGGGAPGCMSGATDPECGPTFSAIGLPWGGVDAVPQSVFRAVAK